MEKPFTLKFPIGGLDKSKGYSTQPPFTTVDCMNVRPSDWTEGRERGGTRPKLVSFPFTVSGTPLNWTDLVYVEGDDGPARRGIAVATPSGVSCHVLTGTAPSITGGGGGDFASCAVFLQTLFYANAGASNGLIKIESLGAGGVEGDTLSVGIYPEVLDDDGVTVLEPETDKGAVPTFCGVVCSHGGRLWLAGDAKAPQVLYASRIGDAQDWDYSAIDQGAAWAASGGVEGKISEPITSLFTHMSNQCLLVGCTDSCYVVTGNPRIGGGHVRSISNSVGPLMQSAICKIGDDRTFFFSRDGLQVVRPGCGEPPTPVSRKQLPKDLVGLNPGDKETVSIGYDSLNKGIHIYTLNVDAEDTYWFYDLQSGGFWPMDFGVPLRLASTYPAKITNEQSGLIAIGTSSHQFVSGAHVIDRDSYLWYGPFALGSPHTEGSIKSITAVLASTSGDIAWGIYTGETAEHALADPKPFTGTWKTRTTGHVEPGLNYKSNPQKRGTMGYLKVESDDKSRWSMEEVMAVRRIAGRRTVG